MQISGIFCATSHLGSWQNPDDVDRMIEIKISYDTDPELALENTRFWAPRSLTAAQKTNIHDPLEREEGRRRAAHQTGGQAVDRAALRLCHAGPTLRVN
jgi:hypothetical protein